MPFPLAAASLAIQGGLGIGQLIAGAARPKPIIPEADIPQEVFQNMSDAEYWAAVGMPESQRKGYIEDLGRTRTATMEGIGSRKGGLGAITKIAQNEADMAKEWARLDEGARYRNIQNLYQARDRVAQERNRAGDINRELALMERERRDEMIGAGLQNIMGGAGTLGLMSSIGGEDFSLGAGGLRSLFGLNKGSDYSFSPGKAPTLSTPSTPRLYG